MYNLVTQVPGCPIASTTATPTGGTKAIAIVDAYDDPNAASDLATFSSYYNLPSANFQVVYAGGSKPSQDSSGGWELEESLDIEYAHAFAPSATIYLVEANSNSTQDLLQAEQVASNLLANAGGGVISNSFGSPEFSGQSQYDSFFSKGGVTYVAATGDCAFCKLWPSTSVNVLAVGGTSIARDSSGNYQSESYWDNGSGGGGGGIGQYNSRPSYQNSVQSVTGNQRGVPDLSSDADPESGVAVYDSFAYNGVVEGWIQIGGTSLASPTIASRIAQIGTVANTNALQTYIYNEYGAGTAYQADFRDITAGNSSCTSGWDICSGIGSPLGINWTAAPAAPFYHHPTTVSCTNSANVSDGSGPLTPNGGSADLTSVNTGQGTNKPVNCKWGGFATSSYVTTSPMTISFSVNAEEDSSRDTVFFSVTGQGTTRGAYQAMYSATVPAGTDLSTLSVSAEAMASNIQGDGCDIQIGYISLQ